MERLLLSEYSRDCDILERASGKEIMIKLLSEDQQEVVWLFERFLRDLWECDNTKEKRARTFSKIRRVVKEIIEDMGKVIPCREVFNHQGGLQFDIFPTLSVR